MGEEYDRTSQSSFATGAQITELEQVFKKFDVNDDGKISWLELSAIMGSVGHPATKDELRFMILEVDSDDDGTTTVVVDAVRTSLCSKGMDKMEISTANGDIIITNDGATILDYSSGPATPLIQFLRDTNSSFFVNLYPYNLYRLTQISSAFEAHKLTFSTKEIDVTEWKGDLLAVGVTEKDQNSKFENPILKKLDSHLGGVLAEVSRESLDSPVYILIIFPPLIALS